MRRLAAICLALGAVLVAASPALATEDKPKKEHKHTICHWANGHVHAISIDDDALETHLVWHEEGGWNPTPGHEQDVYLHEGKENKPEDDLQCQPVTTTTTLPPTTTTTEPPTTTTTLPPTPTTTSDPVLPVIPSPERTPEVPTITDPVTPSIPSLGCTTPEGFHYQTDISEGGCPPVAELVPTVTSLPRTGAAANVMVALGLGLIAAGLTARILARR